jgi:serine/threonine protein kinase
MNTNQSQCPDSPLSQISNITVLKHIHKSNNSIYLAIDPTTKAQYALKSFKYRKDQISDSYKREVRFINVTHPNVIQIFDFRERKRDQHGNLFSYTLLEYAPNGDLNQLITSDNFQSDSKLCRTLFAQVVAGLSHLHKLGISHLDIKPGNILVGSDLQLKIADFDFSHFEGDKEISGLGTAEFRAPEIKDRSCSNPKAADIFSLGLLLYSMYTGVYAYYEDRTIGGFDLEKMVLNKDNKFWAVSSRLSGRPLIEDESFKKLFWGMVSKEPASRLTIDEVAESEWLKKGIYSQEKMPEVMKKFL